MGPTWWVPSKQPRDAATRRRACAIAQHRVPSWAQWINGSLGEARRVLVALVTATRTSQSGQLLYSAPLIAEMCRSLT